MDDYFEVDFLDVESNRSGDAIALRYRINGAEYIHVVDGGFQATGESLRNHISQNYGAPGFIDHVIATHPDGDHAAGLRTIVSEFHVGCLWMNRPWLYSDVLLERFSRFTTSEGLSKRLRECFPNIAALEEIALERGIEIREPIQGSQIGKFSVLAPTLTRYLDLVVESEKTPEASKSEAAEPRGFLAVLGEVARIVKSAWGEESFSASATSSENEMSVVQFAEICGQRLLLTGDAGRSALEEAADYAPFAGLVLPGISRFQVPHHGSRRNLSSEILDRWVGPRLPIRPTPGTESWTAIVSAAKADETHPRKAVVRACMHRGGRVVTTEGVNIRTSMNAPKREGWTPVEPLEYPDGQEV